MQEAQRATKQGVCRLDVVAGKIVCHICPNLEVKKMAHFLNLLATGGDLGCSGEMVQIWLPYHQRLSKPMETYQNPQNVNV